MSLFLSNNIAGPGYITLQEYFEQELFLIDTGKFYILNKSHNDIGPPST